MHINTDPGDGEMTSWERRLLPIEKLPSSNIVLSRISSRFISRRHGLLALEQSKQQAICGGAAGADLLRDPKPAFVKVSSDADDDVIAGSLSVVTWVHPQGRV